MIYNKDINYQNAEDNQYPFKERHDNTETNFDISQKVKNIFMRKYGTYTENIEIPFSDSELKEFETDIENYRLESSFSKDLEDFTSVNTTQKNQGYGVRKQNSTFQFEIHSLSNNQSKINNASVIPFINDNSFSNQITPSQLKLTPSQLETSKTEERYFSWGQNELESPVRVTSFHPCSKQPSEYFCGSKEKEAQLSVHLGREQIKNGKVQEELQSTIKLTERITNYEMLQKSQSFSPNHNSSQEELRDISEVEGFLMLSGVQGI